MPARLAAFVAALLLVPAVAGATVFVIPLPELEGTYPNPAASGTAAYERTATFHLPGLPAVVHGASLHVSGTTEVGVIYCDSGSQSPWPMALSALMVDSPDHEWFLQPAMPFVAGPFEWTAAFRPFVVEGSPIVTWSFLNDGVGEITMNGGPDGYGGFCWNSFPPPTATVEHAWILIDADIPVAAHGASWGAVKAIYR